MIIINVLDLPTKFYISPVPPHWYPVFINKRHLKQLGLSFKFFTKISEKLYECDSLFISSRYFHLEKHRNSEKIHKLEILRQMREHIKKIVWFDLRDSTGNTQFEVLPYVSRYLKKQILKDCTLYQKKLYGNRIYTQYFHEKFNIDDSYDEEFTPLQSEQRTKIGISWNLGPVDNRNGRRLTRLWNLVWDRIEGLFCLQHRMPWISYQETRDINLLALFRTDYERKTISFQRMQALHLLKQIQDEKIWVGQTIKVRKYQDALVRSKIVLSLFGWGEICRRDFEAFTSGAALLMPDVSHLLSWPELHVPFLTYWPIQWDLSDLVESYKSLLSNEKKRIEIAKEGQEQYKKLWTNEGRQKFCKRLKDFIVDVIKNDGIPRVNAPYLREVNDK